MRKIHFFIVIESVLLTFALVTILSGHVSRVILFLLLFLLLLYYYFGKQRSNFMLVTASILFFLIIMLNPYVIAAILFALIYGMWAVYPFLSKDRTQTMLRFDDTIERKNTKNRWIGDIHHFSSNTNCRFDDINLFRFIGGDTIHLEQVILTHHDNVIILRKCIGTTKIIVPVDVAIHLNVNHLYGDLHFLDEPVYELRNESLSLKTPDFKHANKSVKIVIATVVGNVEVVRK